MSEPNTTWQRWFVFVGAMAGLAFTLVIALPASAATVTVDFTAGADIASALTKVRPGDTILVNGTSRQSIVIPAEIQGITIDGQSKATIDAANAAQPAIQILGREIIIKGFTVSGGQFGIAINRGGTAIVEGNTIRNAAHSGIEVSQNSFAKIVNNTIERNGLCGILVLGSASSHIGVLSTADKVARPNIIQNNGQDGIWVVRTSTARIVGNTLRLNRRNGLTIQQASHADVAGNVFNANDANGILVTSNSVLSLADTVMQSFKEANVTSTPNGQFGLRCETGAHVEGPLGSLSGKAGVRDVRDTSCIDRSVVSSR